MCVCACLSIAAKERTSRTTAWEKSRTLSHGVSSTAGPETGPRGPLEASFRVIPRRLRCAHAIPRMRLCWHAFPCLPGPQSVRGCSASALCSILPRRTCLRLILSCICPPLCAGVLWPMPAWVWRDVRSVFFFFFFFNKYLLEAAHVQLRPSKGEQCCDQLTD